MKELIGSEKEQWKRIADEIRAIREKFGPKTALGKRRTGFAQAPEHDIAAMEEALVEREPITIVVSEKGWIRALRGTVTDLAAIAFKTDDRLKFAFPAETTSKCLVFATNGRFYTLDAAKLPGGRGHGEPVRLFIDLEQEGDLVAVFPYQGGRKFLVASTQGQGFVVAEDECLGNTRKGKQVLNVKAPDQACALAVVEGELVASIGENRKMLVFPIEQVPEMARGRGVRLQRFKDGGLSDLKTFKAQRGPDLGRQRRPLLHLRPQGARRLARQPRRCRPPRPEGFPAQQQIRRARRPTERLRRGNSGRCRQKSGNCRPQHRPRRRNAGVQPSTRRQPSGARRSCGRKRPL